MAETFLTTTRSVIFCPSCPPAQSKRQRWRKTGKVALTNFLSAQRTTQEIFNFLTPPSLCADWLTYSNQCLHSDTETAAWAGDDQKNARRPLWRSKKTPKTTITCEMWACTAPRAQTHRCIYTHVSKTALHHMGCAPCWHHTLIAVILSGCHLIFKEKCKLRPTPFLPPGKWNKMAHLSQQYLSSGNKFKFHYT